MLLIPQYEERLEGLSEKLRLADTVTPDLLAEVVVELCPQAARHFARTVRLNNLAKSAAWTDWSLELIRLTLPNWHLRRLAYEDGIWFCSLSEQPHLPLALGDAAEATHEDLPLAILSAIIEARRTGIAPQLEYRSVPHVRPAQGHPVCCDNFA
jgi:hypothetical protein